MSPLTIEISGVSVREMTSEDRNVWADAYAELFPQGTRLGMLQEIDRILKSPVRSGFCAEFSGHMIGFAEYNLRDFANGCISKPVPFLEGIWVDPKFRGQGVARLLISHLENVAKTAGHAEIGSDVLIENESSIEVHKQLGFQETERVVYFRKVL